ncbi:hypothetical protein Drorol1_Dr00019925 [Drosera rotundifolia]
MMGTHKSQKPQIRARLFDNASQEIEASLALGEGSKEGEKGSMNLDDFHQLREQGMEDGLRFKWTSPLSDVVLGRSRISMQWAKSRSNLGLSMGVGRMSEMKWTGTFCASAPGTDDSAAVAAGDSAAGSSTAGLVLYLLVGPDGISFDLAALNFLLIRSLCSLMLDHNFLLRRKTAHEGGRREEAGEEAVEAWGLMTSTGDDCGCVEGSRRWARRSLLSESREEEMGRLEEGEKGKAAGCGKWVGPWNGE